MGMNLFNDGGDSENDDVSKIEIDEQFARRYEHNKKREDLHRWEELKKKGVVEDSDDSDSESDDDEDLINSKDHDLDFFDALIMVKNKDPRLKEEGVKLFEDASSGEGGEGGSEDEEVSGKEKKKKQKTMRLKDVIAKHLIEDGPEYDQEEETPGRMKSYVDEQEDHKRAFLDAVKEEDDDEDGELFKEKARDGEDDIDGGNDGNNEVYKKKIDEYFGDDSKLDENKDFLKRFFLNKMWIDKDKGKKVLDEELEKVSDEEEEVDKQEDYERDYNFRYQENVGDRVLGHSRFVEGSVRKKKSSRKVQRQSKEDRMAIAELERKEELKHLKNLKKKEFLSKLQKVRAVAGINDNGSFVFNEEDLEEEYDPKEHDRKMKEMFNEDYYGADDANPEFCSDDEEEDEDLKKPDFSKEDVLLGLPDGWDDEEEDEEEMAREERGEGKRKRKSKPSPLEKLALENELDEKHKKELKDELYKLDYEGTVGDLKTRFPYRKVNPKRFGLSGKEILMMDDGELNQYVSLKKIAPYRESEYEVSRRKRFEQKKKNMELLEGGKVGQLKMGKRKSLKDDDQTSGSRKDGSEYEKAQVEKSTDDNDKLSRKSKRRRHQQELNLSNSRRSAYGKTDSAPKSKHKAKP